MAKIPSRDVKVKGLRAGIRDPEQAADRHPRVLQHTSIGDGHIGEMSVQQMRGDLERVLVEVVGRVAGLIAVVALTMAATSALATPAPTSPVAATDGGEAPVGLDFGLAPGQGMPASLYLD